MSIGEYQLFKFGISWLNNRRIRMNQTLSLFAAALFFAVAASAQTNFQPVVTSGQTFIHDPSTIVKDHGQYYIFATGPGIRTKSSPDLTNWNSGPPVFTSYPAWIKTFVPTFRNSFWAPDIIRVNGKFLLYYAVSTWQKPISALGLATSPTLDTSATNFAWTDAGPIISSTNGSAYNTIDPSVMLDNDGRLWLSFGSYWEGIFLTELDPQTGKRITTNSPLYHLAWNHSIEASCLTRHDNFYYLFVNWGQCCRGTNSTYEVRIGRSDKVTGPYLDRDGHSLAQGGGSPFLSSSGRFIGPGHIGIVNDGGDGPTNCFSFHYYDGDSHGISRLALGKLNWTNGWPVPAN